MRRILFSLVLFLSSLSSGAQQNHFIYIQTENRQPFYIKHDKKLYSSSVSGYLIVPKLTDGAYQFSIGFPRNEWPEQSINCTVNKKDNGYLLKNFGERGWGLFNLQSLDVMMASKKAAEDDGILRENKTDEFSNVLSSVVNDPSIRQREVVKEEVKVDIPKEPEKTPEPVVKKEPAETVQRSQVVNLLRNTGAEGTELVYVDITGSRQDTIRILIPAEKKPLAEIKTEIKEEAPLEPVVKEEAKPVVIKKEEKKADEKKADGKFIDMELPNPNSKTDSSRATGTEEKKPAVKEPEQSKEASSTKLTLITNSDCRNVAREDDFLKLRKKMAGSDNDDDMISAARKIFKSKCFSTEQIRNLGVLFLKDEGKYKFFDAAYPFVADPANFPGLQRQLTDEYFINRFRAMITH